MLRVCALLFALIAISLGACSDECLTYCFNSGPSFGFRLPEATQRVALSGENCPSSLEVRCGETTQRSIDSPDTECGVTSIAIPDPNICTLSVTLEDASQVSMDFSWSIDEGCCTLARVAYGEGRADLEAAGIVLQRK